MNRDCTPVLIRLDSLVDRMLDHFGDAEISRILGIPMKSEPVDEGDLEQGVYETLDMPTDEESLGKIWEVSWPEHVTTPRFNSDANYLGVAYDCVDDIPKAYRNRLHR